jgi:hypothetical protein
MQAFSTFQDLEPHSPFHTDKGGRVKTDKSQPKRNSNWLKMLLT